MSELAEFRQHVRGWLAANCPEQMRTPIVHDADRCWGGRDWVFSSEAQRLWLEQMASRGWTTPTWPEEFGGAGLTTPQAHVLQEEMTAIRARPPLENFGIWMIGPAILQYGSEPLKKRHLPPIARGEIRWCQGFSEPNAGSDLAALQTRATDHGDYFTVTGQKIWTSYADKSDWMFCLVRTDFDASKHGGISLVLFDMRTPGVTTRPIKLISGTSPFCEVYLDDVRVGKDQVVGEINQGWNIAKYLLTHERETIGGFGKTGEHSIAEEAVEALGRDGDSLADACLRNEIGDWQIDAAAFESTCNRYRAEYRDKGVGHASAMLKYCGTELNKRRHELLLAIHGTDALLQETTSEVGGNHARDWLRSKGNSIEGGTSEIQLNIIAKRILGLP